MRYFPSDFLKKILSVRRNVVTLQSQSQSNIGSLAQLNRASDYGSEGYRFESCMSHQQGAAMRNRGAFACFRAGLGCCKMQCSRASRDARSVRPLIVSVLRVDARAVRPLIVSVLRVDARAVRPYVSRFRNTLLHGAARLIGRPEYLI